MAELRTITIDSANEFARNLLVSLGQSREPIRPVINGDEVGAVVSTEIPDMLRSLEDDALERLAEEGSRLAQSEGILDWDDVE